MARMAGKRAVASRCSGCSRGTACSEHVGCGEWTQVKASSEGAIGRRLQVQDRQRFVHSVHSCAVTPQELALPAL